MAQIISHPLVDEAMIWTTRWRTGAPQGTQLAGNYDALQARTLSWHLWQLSARRQHHVA